MTDHINIRTLGFVAQTKRSIKNGSEFDYLFPKSNGTTTSINADGNVNDILAAMKGIVKRTLNQTKTFSTYLQNRSNSTEQLLKNLFDFIYTHIDYKEDPVGYQDLREPARMWADKYGVCASYSVFISSVLTNLGIKHDFKVVALNNASAYHHVYVIVPKNQKSNLPLISKNDYWVVDPVLDTFDAEAPKITKQQQVVGLNGVNVRVLDGVDDKHDMGLKLFSQGVSGLSGRVDYNNGNVVGFSVQETEEVVQIIDAFHSNKTTDFVKKSLGLCIEVYAPTDSIKLNNKNISPGDAIRIENCTIPEYNGDYRVAYLGDDFGRFKNTRITLYANLGVSGRMLLGNMIKPIIKTDGTATWNKLIQREGNNSFVVDPKIGYSDKVSDKLINPYKTIINNVFAKIPSAQLHGLAGIGSLGASMSTPDFAKNIDTLLQKQDKAELLAIIKNIKAEVNSAPKATKESFSSIKGADIDAGLGLLGGAGLVTAYGTGGAAAAASGATIIGGINAVASACSLSPCLIGPAMAASIGTAALALGGVAAALIVIYELLPAGAQKKVLEGVNNFTDWITRTPDAKYKWDNFEGFQPETDVNTYGKFVREYNTSINGNDSSDNRVQTPGDYLPLLKCIYKNAPINQGEHLIPQDDILALHTEFWTKAVKALGSEPWYTPEIRKHQAFCCAPYIAENLFGIPFQQGLIEAIAFFTQHGQQLNFKPIQDRYVFEVKNAAQLSLLITKNKADNWDLLNNMTPNQAGMGTIAMIGLGLLAGGMLLNGGFKTKPVKN